MSDAHLPDTQFKSYYLNEIIWPLIPMLHTLTKYIVYFKLFRATDKPYILLELTGTNDLLES